MQPRGRLVSRQRLAHVKALGEVTSDRREMCQGVAVLYTLGDDLHPQAVPELYDGRHDRPVPIRDEDVAHERPVDLQKLHGQCLEMCQRCVAGAEVVDRDRHPPLLQPVEDPAGKMWPRNDCGLRDFKVQSFTRQLVTSERLGDEFDEVLVSQRPR